MMAAKDDSGEARAKPLRADARRNYERLVADARSAFLEQGIHASLEDIARRAGVGIGTLYRHFPTRDALVEAVFREEADALIARAGELADADDPYEALADWLHDVLARHRAYRGIAMALVRSAPETRGDDASHSDQVLVTGAGAVLLHRAQQAGAVRRSIEITDVMRLAGAIGLAADHAPEDPGLAGRLLSLATEGLRTRD